MTRTTHGQDPATRTPPTPANEMLESALIVLKVTTFMEKLFKNSMTKVSNYKVVSDNFQGMWQDPGTWQFSGCTWPFSGCMWVFRLYVTIFRRVFRLYVTLFRLYVRPVNIDVAACRLPVPVALYYFQNKCWEKNLFQLQPDWEQQVTMAPPSPSPRLQKHLFLQSIRLAWCANIFFSISLPFS